ncbi:MAG: HEAT repeat domain-containing protein [Planctomycetota bacterium]|jgi:hypothetical protein
MNRLVVIILLAAGIVSAVGCNTSQGAKKKFRFFPPSKDELLTDAVNPDDPDTRREAITELSQSSAVNEQAVQDLFDLILRSDSNSFVRAAAATALGRAQNPQFVPTLANAMADPAMVVRWDAARSLDRVIGEAAIRPLMTAASDDPSLDVRVASVRSLRNYHEPAVVRRLVVLMDDPELPIRREAHNALKDVFGVDLGPGAEDWSQIDRGEIPPGPTMDDKRREVLPWWKRWAYQPKPSAKDTPAPEETPAEETGEEDAAEVTPADDDGDVEEEKYILPAGPGELIDEKKDGQETEAPADTAEEEDGQPEEQKADPQQDAKEEKDTDTDDSADPDAPSALPEFRPAADPATDTDETEKQEPAKSTSPEAPAAEPATEEQEQPASTSQQEPEADESTPTAEPTPSADDITPPERPTRPDAIRCPPSASRPADGPEAKPEEPPAESDE